MNVFIVQTRLINVGCHVAAIFVGCILYADDIILISPSVAGLQQMLDICSSVACSMSLSFSVSKSHCIVLGKFDNRVIAPMTLCGNYVEACDSIK